MAYVYPTNDLDLPERLMAMLGNLWSELYAGRAFIRDRVQGVGELHHQVYLDALEAVDALSRYDVPIFHRKDWRPLTIRQTAVNNTEVAVWRFDTGEFLDASLNFDEANGVDYIVPAVSDLADVSIITNRLTEPSVVLHAQQDFYVSNGTVVFRTNPFANTAIPQTDVFEDGEVVDKEITLWLFRGQYDWELVYEHWGYVLGLQLESSIEYRKLLNAVFDAITGATAAAQVEELVALLADMPLSRYVDELVEDIYDDGRFQWVVTDKACYACSREATVSVAIGDTLQPGDTLITGFERLIMRHGELDSTIPAVVLTRGLLTPEFLGELVFENRDVELVVSGERVTFEISGHPNDVERFWQIVHERRLIYGQSLYQLMRAQGPLPATINPAKFLVANIFRNNFVGYRVQLAQAGSQRIDANPRDLFRRMMPPRSALLLFFELPPLADSVTINNIDDAVLTTFDAMPTMTSDFVPGNLDDTYFTSKIVNFTCH